ncbi:hypothetical protein B7486_74640, partial [cyanobacterium TDX16]
MSDAERPDGSDAASAEHPTARRPLDPRVLRLWRIESGLAWLAAAVVGGGLGALLLADDRAPRVAAALLVGLVVLAVLALVLPGVRYRAWRYEVGDQGLLLEHGVVTRTTSLTPYRRIQHVDVASGPIERSLGLGHLVLHTGSATTDATVPGIPLEDADRLRSVIIE